MACYIFEFFVNKYECYENCLFNELAIYEDFNDDYHDFHDFLIF